ncbi:endoplasmic reticulum-resident kdel protein [Planoprotostelium fungivorum]|uniref:tRNA dimethylallyltransferase n=1 Tax=Planoprotostelium fungivorum TaxID=1890364 RepID=A0A2P6NXZ8_9EUKA|nr:endoplasmic reticulum-resident kdel protein [Planoprotostelium fungivorum]
MRRYQVLVFLIVCLFLVQWMARINTGYTASSNDDTMAVASPSAQASNDPVVTQPLTTTAEELMGEPHPIPEMIESARRKFEQRKLLSEKYKDLSFAREDYKRRYNLDPPRGFDKWHAYMVSQLPTDSVNLIDYDTLMDNLLPYRAIHPKQLRRRIWAMDKHDMMTTIVKVKDGNRFKTINHNSNAVAIGGIQTLLDAALSASGGSLKELELLYNLLDESRSLVAYDVVEKYRHAARQKQYLANADDPVPKDEWFMGEDPKDFGKYDGDMIDQPRPVDMMTLWRKTRDTCPPNSPSRNGDIDPMAGHYFPWDKPDWKYAPLPFTVAGFIRNFTDSTDVCLQNDIQAYYGMIIRPATTKVVVNDLFPFMSQAIMSGYNDILLPSGLYHYNQVRKTDKRVPWNDKKVTMMWRGSSTGGQARNGDWKGIQRGRLVCRLNRQDKSTESVIVDTPLGMQSIHLPTSTLDKLADVAITNILHSDDLAAKNMKETPCLRVHSGGMPFETLPEYRYLLDVDGNSFSSRFQELLRMKSVVIKSQLVYEWFTSSVIPWYHYVPMNMRFSDTYDIVTWFEGFSSLVKEGGEGLELREAVRILKEKKEGKSQAEAVVALSAKPHLKEAEAIAEQGAQFAAGNLRGQDAVIFVYRLLIEWEEMLDIGGKGGSDHITLEESDMMKIQSLVRLRPVHHRTFPAIHRRNYNTEVDNALNRESAHATVGSEVKVPKKKVLLLTGPTGGGKSSLGMDYAKLTGSEIVSADAIAVFKGWTIAAAKPTAQDMAEVPHHLVDVAEFGDDFTAIDFRTQALAAINSIHDKGKIPVVVGGSNFYQRVLLYGLHEELPKDTKMLQEQYSLDMANDPDLQRKYYDRLSEIDPRAAWHFGPGDAYRISRALAVCDASGRTYSSFRKEMKEEDLEYDWRNLFVVWRKVTELSRIEDRCEKMIMDGLFQEIMDFFQRFVERPKEGANLKYPLGCMEAVQFLLYGDFQVDAFQRFLELFKTSTRQLAKSQRTWGRASPMTYWVPAEKITAQDIDRLVNLPAEEFHQQFSSENQTRMKTEDAFGARKGYKSLESKFQLTNRFVAQKFLNGLQKEMKKYPDHVYTEMRRMFPEVVEVKRTE